MRPPFVRVTATDLSNSTIMTKVVTVCCRWILPTATSIKSPEQDSAGYTTVMCGVGYAVLEPSDCSQSKTRSMKAVRLQQVRSSLKQGYASFLFCQLVTVLSY